jgi:F-type H+-transporting ATPase subunit delta
MSVARSYARALLETLHAKGATPAAIDEVEAHLSGWVDSVSTHYAARVALESPATSVQEKVGVAASLSSKLGFNPILAKLFEIMAKKQRLAMVPELRDAFRSVRLESEGGVLGSVVSADPLSAQDLHELAQAFSAKVGKKVAFQAKTDPSLLAGLKVSVAGVTYDGSLRAQLDRLGRKLAGQVVSH